MYLFHSNLKRNLHSNVRQHQISGTAIEVPGKTKPTIKNNNNNNNDNNGNENTYLYCPANYIFIIA
jgi:hypothetical protein